MKTQHAIRTVTLVALLAAPITAVQAAGPFQLRRATAASAVSTVSPLAVIATSPFDGEPVASGGVSYDYEVFDASGSALDIAVQINAVTQTLRISFDDGNPASAPVDAAQSSISVVPSSISANGLQSATITIVPRDASGVLLGRGMAVSIDSSLLWPAQLSGPIVDRGDGSYVATAIANVPGTGAVRAAVEGVVLAPSPTITANAVGPMSLRDLAIAQLLGEVRNGGPLANLLLQAGPPGPPSPQSAKLNGAINAINNTAVMLANTDPSHDDTGLRNVLGEAMMELEGVMNDPGTVNTLDLRDAMDDLLGIARLVAQWHVDQTTSACGACVSGKPAKVCNTIAALATADAMRAAVSPDWSGTLDAYANVVALALQARQSC